MRGRELPRGASTLTGALVAVLIFPFRPGVPFSGLDRRSTRRESRLVLPAPDGPHRRTTSPGAILKLRFENRVVLNISPLTPNACCIFLVDRVRIKAASSWRLHFSTQIGSFNNNEGGSGLSTGYLGGNPSRLIRLCTNLRAREVRPMRNDGLGN